MSRQMAARRCKDHASPRFVTMDGPRVCCAGDNPALFCGECREAAGKTPKTPATAAIRTSAGVAEEDVLMLVDMGKLTKAEALVYLGLEPAPRADTVPSPTTADFRARLLARDRYDLGEPPPSGSGPHSDTRRADNLLDRPKQDIRDQLSRVRGRTAPVTRTVLPASSAKTEPGYADPPPSLADLLRTRSR